MNASEIVGKKPVTLSTAQVREIVNHWSGKGFLRVRNLGDRSQIEAIRTHSAYTIRLRSQYEQRSVGPASRPHQGGSVDDHGVPPEPWAIRVSVPDDFDDRTQTLSVPHTERVHPCGDCGGAGKVNCRTCQGWGKVNCPFCNGRGYRERTEFRNVPGPGGTMQTQPATVRDNCTCFGGKVNCSNCHGSGKIQCSTCAGAGSVVNYQLLTVKFRVDERTEVINPTQIPAAQMKAAVGAVLVDERAARIDAVPAVLAEVDHPTADLLRQSHEEAQGDTRLHFQQLHIEQVGVHEVDYRYGNGKIRQLWIYGADNVVHALGAPRAWLRLLTVLAGSAIAIAAIGYLLFAFVLRP
jgi:hypothetical protein